MLQRIKEFFDQHLVPESLAGSQDAEHALRLAVGALLLEMMHVDGEKWSEQQEAVKTAVLEHFDLETNEAMELLQLAESELTDSTDYFQFTSLINEHYTAVQKISLVELLWRIAYANDSLHQYEEHLVRKVANLLHVPHSTFIATKLKVIDE